MYQFKKIYLEITNNCNLNCDFCIKNKRKNKSIELDEFKIILNKLKPHTKYLYFHVLGEPLTHNNINELIDIASNDFDINITTNGYLINKIRNNKNIRQLNISLHSYNDKTNKTIDEYLKDIFDSIDILNQYTYISLRLWVKNKYNNYIIDYINKRYNTNISYDVKDTKIIDNVYINNFHEFIWPDLSNNHYEETGKCYALKDHIAILSDGTIIPCCLDSRGDIALGNIFNDEIENIINNNRAKCMLEGFKNNKKVEELCKHCSFLN